MEKSGVRFCRRIAAVLAVAMIFSFVRLLPFGAFAEEVEYTDFDSGAVLLDGSFSGKNVLIKNGVFSVTVSGAKNVNILFEGVTIDHRYTSDPFRGQTVENLYDVARTLGWGTGTGGYYAQTCPLLITGQSSATVAFRGVNTLYAGTNRCTVSSSGVYGAVQNGGGFAGIQVDAGSTLTVSQSTGTVHAYGAYYVEGDNSENSSYGYQDPPGAEHAKLVGGAGIGGGAAWNTSTSFSSGYTAGTPGTIIINGGNINAYGGHEAAGIGGGLNSAATATSITINGGNVNAYGGRWAAGIGDGDSLQNAWSTKYTDDYKICINGGTVYAVGGVACPGIGCTDQVSSGWSRTGTSGLQIDINGGRVTVRSGYPDKFNPKGTAGYTGTDAAAAIGAGNNTNMHSNSISVSSAAEVIASGFGHYSITENGTQHDALPTVTIDSDSYMYLGRFPNLSSSEERTFRLLRAIREQINGYTYTKYATQPEDGSAGAEYYFDAEAVPPLLDADKNAVTDADGNVLGTAEILKLMEQTHIVLAVSAQSEEIKQVVAPAFFRSIALTLPKPEDYGGIYALKVPTASLVDYKGTYQLPKSGYIVIDIGAEEQGTISGELSYPSTGNVKLDLVSEPLTDLDVYPDAARVDGSNGLIGDSFLQNVYAYRVYISNDAKRAYLYFAYRKIDGVTHELTIPDDVKDQIMIERDGYMIVTGTVDMTGTDEKVLRIKKTDKGADPTSGDSKSLNSIVYKVTVTRKTAYRIGLTDLSKIYDGKPVSAVITDLHSGEKSYAVYRDTHGLLEKNASGSFLYTLPDTVELTSAGNRYGVVKDNRNCTLTLDLVCKISVSGGDLIYRVEVTVKDSEGVTLTDQSPAVFRFAVTPGENELPAITDTSPAATVSLGYTGTETTDNSSFFLRSDGAGRITIDYGGTDAKPLFSLSGEASTATVKSADSTARDAAEQAAKAALDSGATTGSWSYAYTENRTTTGTHTASLTTLTYANGTNTVTDYESASAVYSRDCTHTEHGRYYITAQAGGNYTVFVPTAEELAGAVYTYYRSTDGGQTWTALQGAPKNAGYYKVRATVSAASYQAEGELVFEIHRRVLTVSHIENAITYVTSADYRSWTAPHTIDTPGTLHPGNLVTGDSVTVRADRVYYNDITIGYGTGKITLEGVTLEGDAETVANYLISDVQHVFGQITYSMDGAIFRRDDPDSAWEKFYPVDSKDPVDKDSADYHSPADANGNYTSHRDYIYGRTVGDGGTRVTYAVDIEFGTMSFTYSLTVWNAGTLQYEELEGESRWSGFDGKTNAVTVYNRSNAAISYVATSKIDFLHSSVGDSSHGISSGLYAENNRTSEQVGGKAQQVPAATPGSSTAYGSPGVGKCYLILSGIPQFSDSDAFVTVGEVTVMISTSSGISG